MRILLLILIMTCSAHASVYFEVNWNHHLQKELIISCEGEESFCGPLCQNQHECVILEGACRDCIGTSLTMTNLLNELGRTVVTTGNTTDNSDMLELLLSGEFVTLTPNDVYNVIDASGSIRAMKKFEKLCPDYSLDQILFLKVDAYTRKIQFPAMVSCLMEEGSVIFDITSRPEVVVQESLRLLY